ncbi:hypothetical protein LY474_01075 [Myxococcus stipitatus]|uniref:hypothetical protein n=1 Tax=Myxococcus stipitatus TaxID=83455 RepID=UPI001F4473A2|nr:hypothetical protein [Myxococcus stipitatus]MCE9666390.1 hypothetical protein [Myxococcus stipitatus]
MTCLQVVTTQATLLAAEQKLVALAGQRMVSTVGLIKALGGGWDARGRPPKKP